MAEAAKSYTRVDEHGVIRVGDTRCAIDGIIYSFREGRSPESIRRSYQSLTLEDVYGAIAYYLANRKELDEYLLRQEADWDRLRAEQDRNPPPVVRRLKALRDKQREGAA
jgi:uncharacterized protein (DUF433 family)